MQTENLAALSACECGFLDCVGCVFVGNAFLLLNQQCLVFGQFVESISPHIPTHPPSPNHIHLKGKAQRDDVLVTDPARTPIVLGRLVWRGPRPTLGAVRPHHVSPATSGYLSTAKQSPLVASKEISFFDLKSLMALRINIYSLAGGDRR